MHHEITSLLKRLLLSATEVTRLPNLERSTTLFAQGESADALYFVEEGLIKVTRTNSSSDRLILEICGPNSLLGEESLGRVPDAYRAEAEVLSVSTVYRIPITTLKRQMDAHPELSVAMMQHLVEQKLDVTFKVELLCLRDVQYRVLYYLEELAKLVKPGHEGGRPLPITQLELGDLVGATRETTSTTLNHLEKKGFVKLSRRLLTVNLPHSRGASAGGSDGDSPVPI